jgi:Sterol-sensing domain of SREBP cleavage-activation
VREQPQTTCQDKERAGLCLLASTASSQQRHDRACPLRSKVDPPLGQLILSAGRHGPHCHCSAAQPPVARFTSLTNILPACCHPYTAKHHAPCRFSIYATICVATNFVVLTTFFLAAFVLNERRMAAHRLDCCCCIVAAAAKTQPGDAASTDGSSVSAGAHPHAG